MKFVARIVGEALELAHLIKFGRNTKHLRAVLTKLNVHEFRGGLIFLLEKQLPQTRL